ncbi:hypothetical protein D9758_015333 [Tetrapyrgos nigripes]|uniref:Uncharacterized protein n=1 Tax=Tetrapyrgos nigripes TaxID=182062 RepID=A0A8H5CN95_9AGAR|nr:hypothetical protein D9758_015333 [Tetrapyrgos nigripes]
MEQRVQEAEVILEGIETEVKMGHKDTAGWDDDMAASLVVYKQYKVRKWVVVGSGESWGNVAGGKNADAEDLEMEDGAAYLPDMVAQIQQPLPEGLVKVYVAWCSHIQMPHEILVYWPKVLYEKCYIVVKGCRIGIFPTWSITKLFVDTVSGARFQSLKFLKALEHNWDCYNRVPPNKYLVVNFHDHALGRHDIEIAVDNMGHMFTFAMGSPESSILHQFTIHILPGMVAASIAPATHTFIGPPIDLSDVGDVENLLNWQISKQPSTLD